MGCGKNDGGQLGNGSTTNATSAVTGTNSCDIPENIHTFSATELIAFPNPTNNIISISAQTELLDATFIIYDILGKKLNIVGLYLNTNATIGYVVLDIEGIEGEIDLHELRNIPHTMRVRLLY